MGVAEIIREQLGHRAFVMMGAKNLVKGTDKVGKFLAFKIGSNSKKVNFVKITLNGLDLYNIEFGYIRGINYTVRESVTDVFVDEMHETIEKNTGIYLSL